jgi:putative SOS response-associated peptidase YedK
MPAILAVEDHATWLTGTPDEAFSVLKQFPSGEMFAYPVGNQVNSNRNDGPDLIKPRGEEGGQPDLFG